jgi:hypothetical protein
MPAVGAAPTACVRDGAIIPPRWQPAALAWGREDSAYREYGRRYRASIALLATAKKDDPLRREGGTPSTRDFATSVACRKALSRNAPQVLEEVAELDRLRRSVTALQAGTRPAWTGGVAEFLEFAQRRLGSREPHCQPAVSKRLSPTRGFSATMTIMISARHAQILSLEGASGAIRFPPKFSLCQTICWCY